MTSYFTFPHVMGGMLSVARHSLPPCPTWVYDIPDLTGKAAIVTGAFINLGACLYANTVTGGNTGVGKETVKVRFSCHRKVPNLADTLYRHF
jgi:hypothetical protein